MPLAPPPEVIERCYRAALHTATAYSLAPTIEKAAAVAARYFRRDPNILWAPGVVGNKTLDVRRDTSLCVRAAMQQKELAETQSVTSGLEFSSLLPKLARIHELGMLTMAGQGGLIGRQKLWDSIVPTRQRAALWGVLRASRFPRFMQQCLSRGLASGEEEFADVTYAQWEEGAPWRSVTGASLNPRFTRPLKARDRGQRARAWARLFFLRGATKDPRTGKNIFTPLVQDLVDNGTLVSLFDPVWGRPSFLHDVVIDALQATR